MRSGKRVIGLTTALSVVCSGAFADSGSWLDYNGTPGFAGGEHDSVKMVFEDVNVRLYEDYADVVAVFEFENSGAASDVEMFFPVLEAYELNWVDATRENPEFWEELEALTGLTRENTSKETTYDLVGENDYLRGQFPQGFELDVDGEPGDVYWLERVYLPDNPDEYDAIHREFITRWSVPFTAGQKREIRCRYRVNHGYGGGEFPPRLFAYKLGTGATWAGVIGKGSITITNETDFPLFFRALESGVLEPAELSEYEGNEVITYDFVEYEPPTDCTIIVVVASPDASVSGCVDVDNLNFRVWPSPEADRVAGNPTLAYGTGFDIVDGGGEWWKVRLRDGTEGWLRWRYVDPDTDEENIYAEMFY